MFTIKICGITRVEDAIEVARLGVDAVGLNFFEPSPRSITRTRASEILRALPPEIARVGIFVNHSRDFVVDAYDRLPLDYAQLHGDESAEFAASLAPRRVIRAFRGIRQLPVIDRYLDRCEERNGTLAAVLVDADVAGQFGGTGVRVDWDELRAWQGQRPAVPFVLSGGLNPANIATAIRTVAPDAVDTASGVESEPGRKDLQLVARFATEARRAWEQMQG